MERNTRTIAEKLQIGDRFYKANDKQKTVCQMVEGGEKKTEYRNSKLWYLPPNTPPQYPKAIDKNTEVIFLRHTNN
ncbi:hypothetical protein J3L18_29555 [Mucilaginibacter gossypii]|uniref:hypothetical protein n=1 Tax=Mucilaginibacter gossypii TaxID=551996 RepID=UPI000DCD1F21|nr:MULTISPECIES: hypothetical protein [Mucilaginibacter]QTE37204.1 hypothetical protein J3L18_29555 [Mucilaginibacter gossypii]RAV57167.1 hypothetical protein DIU36_12645 [Mucilaginibacter rubeus]